jgi:hypothetical protein
MSSIMKKQIGIIICLAISCVALFESASYAGRRGSSRSGSVRVRGYFRKDGTYVRLHTRTAPDGICSNNISGCSGSGSSGTYSAPADFNLYPSSSQDTSTPSEPSDSQEEPQYPQSVSPAEPSYPSPSPSDRPNPSITSPAVPRVSSPFLSIPFENLISDSGRLKVQRTGANLSYSYFEGGRTVIGYVKLFSTTERKMIGKFKDTTGFGCQGEVIFEKLGATRWASTWDLIPFHPGDKCDAETSKLMLNER